MPNGYYRNSIRNSLLLFILLGDQRTGKGSLFGFQNDAVNFVARYKQKFLRSNELVEKVRFLKTLPLLDQK